MSASDAREFEALRMEIEQSRNQSTAQRGAVWCRVNDGFIKLR
jgi:hypothetical protein